MSVQRYTLTRVGAGPGVAVFSCDSLLGQVVKVIDADDYDALGEKHREMAIIWCKDEARHIRDREMARMEADKYKAALQMIVKLFENEDFMDESSDILDVLEIAERALK